MGVIRYLQRVLDKRIEMGMSPVAVFLPFGSKTKAFPLGPGMAVTVEGEELLTLRCSPLLGNQRIPIPMGLGGCFKVYHLTFQYLVRLTEKMLQLLTVFLQYVDES